MFNLPWLVAREEGLFDKYKVRVELVPGGRDQSLEGICQDPNQVASIINHTPFIEGKAQGVGSCEWGNVRRASDYNELVGAKIFRKRSAVITPKQ